MSVGRLILGAAIAAGICATAPQDPAGATELRGLTVVEGVGSAALDLEVPSPLRAPGTGDTDREAISFALPPGSSRFFAVQLKRGGASSFAVRRRDGRAASSFATHDVLPPGGYRLLVMTDQPEPWRVEVRAPELTGSLELVAALPLPVHAHPAETRSSRLPNNSVFASGIERSEEGMLFVELTARYSDPTAARVEFCTYSSRAAAMDPDAYDVGCPGGSSTTHLADPALSEGVGGHALYFDREPGFDGVGGNFSNGGEPSIDAFAAFVPYRLDSPAPATVRDISGERSPRIRPTRPSAHRRGNRVRVRVRCFGDAACQATARLGSRGRPLRLNLPAGAARTLHFQLGGRDRRKLRHGSTVRLRIDDSTRSGSSSFRIRIVDRTERRRR